MPMNPAAIQWWMEQMANTAPQNMTPPDLPPTDAGEPSLAPDLNPALGGPGSFPGMPNPTPNEGSIPNSPATFQSVPSTVASGGDPTATPTATPFQNTVDAGPGLTFSPGDFGPGFQTPPPDSGGIPTAGLGPTVFDQPALNDFANAPQTQNYIPPDFTNPAPNDFAGNPQTQNYVPGDPNNPAPNDSMSAPQTSFYYPAGDGTYVQIDDTGKPIGTLPTQDTTASITPDLMAAQSTGGPGMPIGGQGLPGNWFGDLPGINSGPLPGANLPSSWSTGPLSPGYGLHVGANKNFVNLGADTAPMSYDQWIAMGSPGSTGSAAGPSAAPGSGRAPGGVQ